MIMNNSSINKFIQCAHLKLIHEKLFRIFIAPQIHVEIVDA